MPRAYKPTLPRLPGMTEVRVVGRRRPKPGWLRGLFLAMIFALGLVGFPSREALALDQPGPAELVLPEAPPEYSSYSTDWMDLRYAPELAGKVEVLKQVAGRTREEYRTLLGDQALKKVFVRVAPSAEQMARLTPSGIGYPKYASGVAYPSVSLVLLTASPRFPGEALDLAQVFRHELLHIALHDAVSDRAPRWFDEGLAVHLSGELYVDRLTTLATATLTKRLLPLRQLTHGFPRAEADASVAYAQAADLVRYLLRGEDEKRFPMLLERMRAGEAFETALAGAYSLTLADLETEWQKDVASRYTFWPVLLGGSTIWGVAFVLLFAAFYKRRRETREKLKRWAKEEAVEDARLELLRRALAVEGEVRVVRVASLADDDSANAHSTMAQLAQGRLAQGQLAPGQLAPGGVPRVEHEGQWHTLH